MEYNSVYRYLRRRNERRLCTDIEEIKRYMGCRGRAPVTEDITALAERAAAVIDSTSSPKGCFMLCGASPEKDGVKIGDEFFASCDLAFHLDGCRDAILLAVTLGAATDREIKKASATDISLAYALDCAACAAIERFADELCDSVAAELVGRGLTERFSPGYGDLSLEYQPTIAEILGAGKLIGVGVNDSLLLSPSKSVTAIVGIR